MKIKKLAAILLIMLSIFALTGCRLAKADAGEGATKDRLIGALVTKEHLDLFDFEGYLNDNIGSFLGGRTQINRYEINGHSDKYEGRIYAKLKELELIHEDTGEVTTTEEYVFEDVEGISYFAATIPARGANESYMTTGSDEAISDGHTSIFQSNDEEKITLKGTVYTSVKQDHTIQYFINPVYQEEDGGVYVVSGSGITLSGECIEGGSFTQTLEETIDEREDGKSKMFCTTIEITIEAKFPPEKIVVLEMDESSALLSNKEYSPGEVPDKLTPDAKTDYIIVETHKRDDTGASIVTRELFDREDESLTTIFCREDDICINKWTQLIWKISKSKIDTL